MRICSAHFSPEAYRKTLNGRRETHDTALPTLFRPKHDCTPRSARYEKSSKRRRLESNDEDNACLENQLPLAATDSEDLTHVDYSYADFCNVEHDHPYCLSPENDQTPKRLFEIPEPEKIKSVGCQTDISTSDFEKLEDEVKNLKKRLAGKNTLKRDLFIMDDVLKNDDSVKFYTGIPSLGCFNLISDLLKPQAEKLKYRDKNKDKQMKYQTAVDSKPGPKRGLTLNEELIVTLVRLRLGLMGRQLADIFSVLQSQLSRIFTTWVCFLATVLKEVLVLWPSQENDSGKFYTGIPSLGCFNLISDLRKSQAEKLKYWDKNKDKQMKYQTAVDSKPEPKRGLTLKEELIVTLVRLRLGLMPEDSWPISFLFAVTAQQDLYNMGLLSCNGIERGTSALVKSRGSET